MIPRQIARELLYTLRFILYPWEEASRALATEAGFELASLGLEIFGYSYDDDDNFDEQQYRRWGAKLLALVDIVNMSKVGRLRKWTRAGNERVTKVQRGPKRSRMLMLGVLTLLATIVFGVFQLLTQRQDVMSKLG